MISSSFDLHFEDINVGSFLENTLLSFYNDFEQRHITPCFFKCKEQVVRKLDRSALTRILENIIGNAIKYSDGDFSASVTEAGEIVFSNTASKLSPVDVGKLFDRFYTVDSARKSTGLGLSIAKLLTERMNGSISADYKNNMLSITVFFKE